MLDVKSIISLGTTGDFRMAGFGDLVQKAFYMGVGLASYAGEKAGGTLAEVQQQAQKLADELVARGEMTTDEAKRMVDDMVRRAQSAAPTVEPQTHSEPRRIEILEDEPSPAEAAKAEALRQQVESLQNELRRLQRD